MCVNSKALEMVGYSYETNAEGVIKDDAGHPTGELQEMAAMFPVMRRLSIDFRSLSQTESAIRSYAKVCQRAGVTTVTDLFSTLTDEDVTTLTRVTGEAQFPVRIVPALAAIGAARGNRTIRPKAAINVDR